MTLSRSRWFTALLLIVLLTAQAVQAGVIRVQGNTYSLDGGQPVTGMWEIAEKIAYAKDVAIVVVDPNAGAETIQALLRLLEGLNIPTILTKEADYKRLVDQGVLRPTTTP